MTKGILIALVTKANRTEIDLISTEFESLGYYPDDGRRKKQYITLCLNRFHGTADGAKMEQAVRSILGG